MTKKEMTEIFSLFMMAYPSAEIFKGGKEKLGPTIMFWADQFADVDFQTGVEAARRLCKTSKYPPTQAEYEEQIKMLSTKHNYLSTSAMWASLVEVTETVADLMTEFDYTFAPDGIKTQGQMAREKAQMIFENLAPALQSFFGSYSGMLQYVREFNPSNATGMAIKHRDFEKCMAAYSDYEQDALNEAHKHVVGYNGCLPITD